MGVDGSSEGRGRVRAERASVDACCHQKATRPMALVSLVAYLFEACGDEKRVNDVCRMMKLWLVALAIVVIAFIVVAVAVVIIASRVKFDPSSLTGNISSLLVISASSSAVTVLLMSRITNLRTVTSHATGQVTGFDRYRRCKADYERRRTRQSPPKPAQ
jgi:hypothetical protein